MERTKSKYFITKFKDLFIYFILLLLTVNKIFELIGQCMYYSRCFIVFLWYQIRAYLAK